jgi:cyclic-di-GMP phosphodiesterase TipF (flagellum assembly factor)
VPAARPVATPTAPPPAPRAAAERTPVPVPAPPRGRDVEPAARFKSLTAPAAADVVAEAVAANRLEFHLQPILMLPQRKLRYYEALARLRTADGELVVAGDFLEIAEAAGLMARIDNMMLFRCVQVVRRLMAKKRDVGVFCNISAATLADAEFFPQFAEFMEANRAIAPALVFEFDQATYRKFGPKEKEGLAALVGWGYRFSMDHVGDLRFEPRDLAERGFRFVKVPAPLLLDRAAGGGSDIDALDLSGLLTRFGVELIAEKIESEGTVVDLLDYNVKYGQGYLFAQPRAVRADVLQAAPESPDPRAAAVASEAPAPTVSKEASKEASQEPSKESSRHAAGGTSPATEPAPEPLAQRTSAIAQLARVVVARARQ